MLNSLRIQNFRLLNEFSIPHLGRVNLIVGKNNSGKSTVLEALRIFARQANPQLLSDIVQTHDENFLNPEPGDSVEKDAEIAYQHFFPSRRFPTSDDNAIYIGDVDRVDYVTIDHAYYLDEFDEIRVDRLSPDDAQTLRKGSADATLKGIQFHHFGAFFSMAYRQNDYLWGRLHAADRLIDIVLDAARIEGAAKDLDVLALKAKAFNAILDVESTHLLESLDLIAQLRKEIAALLEPKAPSTAPHAESAPAEAAKS